ncbi:MAG: DUF2191 domain-containing protein [Pseudomonadota bacterium]
MKVTLDLAADLLRQAKARARIEGTNVRALVERGLRLALDENRARRKFKLRDASVGGNGMHPDAAGRSWRELLARCYGFTPR